MGQLNQKDALFHAEKAFMRLEQAEALASEYNGAIKYSAEITALASLASAHFAALVKR